MTVAATARVPSPNGHHRQKASSNHQCTQQGSETPLTYPAVSHPRTRGALQQGSVTFSRSMIKWSEQLRLSCDCDIARIDSVLDSGVATGPSQLENFRFCLWSVVPWCRLWDWRDLGLKSVLTKNFAMHVSLVLVKSDIEGQASSRWRGVEVWRLGCPPSHLTTVQSVSQNSPRVLY
ncbi:hypothetical protein AVEN_62249-1 [Araneus ventricosus]|uniref:Uncharacterized protein n=1 Tax=Araneus ventricosus TaxID=182803 RepID=A0A4Y2E8K0_ARAVE|nr:hypothetical protein AVEN_62249-1 [Araneus ventricosus]